MNRLYKKIFEHVTFVSLRLYNPNKDIDTDKVGHYTHNVDNAYQIYNQNNINKITRRTTKFIGRCFIIIGHFSVLKNVEKMLFFQSRFPFKYIKLVPNRLSGNHNQDFFF